MTVVTTLACPLCRIAIASPETICPRDGQPGEAVVWNAVPTSLGKRFRVLEPFAHGATGSMYLADESESGRRGLLKVLTPVPKHREPERARLRRELSKQATLENGRLVVPWASGESEGQTWLFRPWLDGVSLRVRLRQSDMLPMLDALAVSAQLAAALDELHRGGLLHRDLKPSHVFLQTNAQGQPRAALIEAGVCGSIARPGNSTIFGSAGYVAPEQLAGKLVSFRSDLYSLGCVMYEMLAGHPPFHAESDQAIMAAQLTGEIPPLPAGLPANIAGLLRSLLAKEPQERPFSAQKLRRILDPYAPQGAPMTRQPTSTFATSPEPEKAPGKPVVEPKAGPSMPPPPPAAAVKTTQAMFGAPGLTAPRPTHRPTVRGVAPPPPPRTPVSADPTLQVDLDQIEELEAEAQDATQELSPRHLEPAAPAPQPAKIKREDHTVPVRLDQILSMAPAKLRASASAPPPPLEQPPEPVVVPSTAPVPAAHFMPPPEPSLFEPAEASAPVHGASGHAHPDTTMAVDESLLSEASVQLPAPAALPQPSSSLFGALPEPTRDPLYDSAFNLADEDDSDDVVKTTVAPRPERPSDRPYTAAAASSTLDDDATQVHPSNRAPGDDDDDVLPSRTLLDTLHPYLGRTPESRRKLMMYGGAAAGLLLLVWGVSALSGGDDDAIAHSGAPQAPAAVAPAAPPPLPAPVVEPAPSVTTLDKAAPAEAKPVAEPPQVAAPVAASKPIVEPRPSVEPAEPRETVAVAPSKSSSGSRNAREERRTTRHEEKVAASKKASSKKADASAERAAKWAEARDQARAHYAAKRYKQAAQAYERASTFDPTNAGTFAGLGAARLQSGDAKGAVAAYQRAIQLSPSSAGFHLALGRAYVAAGDKSKAKAAYKRAISLDPKNESAKSSLKELG